MEIAISAHLHRQIFFGRRLWCFRWCHRLVRLRIWKGKQQVCERLRVDGDRVAARTLVRRLNFPAKDLLLDRHRHVGTTFRRWSRRWWVRCCHRRRNFHGLGLAADAARRRRVGHRVTGASDRIPDALNSAVCKTFKNFHHLNKTREREAECRVTFKAVLCCHRVLLE